MERFGDGSGADVDKRPTNYAMAELTRDAPATSAFMQRVRVHQQGEVDDVASLRLRRELRVITRSPGVRVGSRPATRSASRARASRPSW